MNPILFRYAEPVVQELPLPGFVHIAVLDDEGCVRDLLADILRDQGFRVSTFSAGKPLLDALSSVHFDLIISDVNMPSMSGFEFYATACTLCPSQAQRILFLTGDEQSQGIQDWLRLTGNTCLAKPFSSKKLMCAIALALNRAKTSEAAEPWNDTLPNAA